MYKSILVILLVGLLAAPAMAVPPPAYDGDPAGWGNSPLEWDNSFGTCSKCALWDPDVPGWNVFIGNAPFCCEMTVELWIELHAIMTVEGLWHQFHSIGAAQAGDRFDFYVIGVTSSNNPLNICMVPGIGFDLNYLQFIEDIMGDDNGEADIPLNWYYAYGPGSLPPNPANVANWTRGDPNPCLCITIEQPCDWWWIYWGWFIVVYHEDDGYYLLLFAICPTPIL
jgi:hypothetical protein